LIGREEHAREGVEVAQVLGSAGRRLRADLGDGRRFADESANESGAMNLGRSAANLDRDRSASAKGLRGAGRRDRSAYAQLQLRPLAKVVRANTSSTAAPRRYRWATPSELGASCEKSAAISRS